LYQKDFPLLYTLRSYSLQLGIRTSPRHRRMILPVNRRSSGVHRSSRHREQFPIQPFHYPRPHPLFDAVSLELLKQQSLFGYLQAKDNISAPQRFRACLNRFHENFWFASGARQRKRALLAPISRSRLDQRPASFTGKQQCVNQRRSTTP
jgi:hypothetical protein